MKNTNQCCQGLLYNSFAIIQLQTFYTDSLRVVADGEFVKGFKDPVDCQLFTNQQKFYERYELKGFDVNIDIDDKNTLKGRVHVRAIKFFDSCMQLSYRFVVAKMIRIRTTFSVEYTIRSIPTSLLLLPAWRKR